MVTDFLTVEDLADRWHTTVKAIYAMHHRRQLPVAHRIGRRLLWARADVEAFEAQRREHLGTPATTPQRAERTHRSEPPAQYPWLRAVP